MKKDKLRMALWIYSQTVALGTTIVIAIFYIQAYLLGFENITLHTNAFNEQLIEIIIFVSGLILFIYFFKKKIDEESEGDVKNGA